MSAAYFLFARKGSILHGHSQIESNQTHDPTIYENKLNSKGHFFNGALSNAIMVAVMNPFFVLKTYTMSGLGKPPISKLYSGVVTNLISGSCPEGITFLVQDRLKDSYFQSKAPTSIEDLAISCVAGAAGSPLNSGFERIMIQQQLTGQSAKKVIEKMIKAEGFLRAFSKGMSCAIIRDALFNIGIFTLNDQIHSVIQKSTHNEHSSLVSGMISGAIVGGLSTPFDLIKTRMQSDLENKFSKPSIVAKKILKNEGIMGLFLGAKIRSCLIGGMVGLICISKEKIPNFFPKYFQN
jgi:hypothetical protein